MTEQPESTIRKEDPVEKLEDALVRMAFVLEQRESQVMQQQKKKNAQIARVEGQIDALGARITAFLQEAPLPEQKKE